MKPLGIYQALGMFGMNVGIVEGQDWTRHRRIVAGPSFAEVSVDLFAGLQAQLCLQTTNKGAWDETMKTMDACFEDWDVQRSASGSQDVVVDSLVKLTLKVGDSSHIALWYN